MGVASRTTESDALPDPLRGPAVLAASLSALLFVVLAARYRGDADPGRLDIWAERMVDGVSAQPLRFLVRLGDPVPVVVIACLLAALALYLQRRRLALLAVLGPGLTGVATSTLKPSVGRELHGSFAYPSGHTGVVCALGIVAALILVSAVPLGRLAAAALVAAGAVLPGILMGIGLTQRDWHYPTDTVGGGCVAVVVVLGLALLLDHGAAIASRRANRSG